MAKAKRKSKLVVLQNDMPVTTSVIIAEGTNNQHESVIRLITENKEHFKRWGQVQFSDLKSGNPKGGRPTKVAYLNEQQATFLMTLLRNNEVVINFKAELVDQFYKMRQKLIALTPEEIQRQKIRRAGIDFGRKPCMEQIHKFNLRDFEDGDKNPRGKARYGRYTKRTQIDHAGIPKGGRDSASGAELAAQFAGERASAVVFAHGLEIDAPYNPTETEAIDTFKGIYDLIFNNKYLDNPPLAPLLTA